MASNRHLGRIVALQTLYELDFRIEVEEKNLDRDAVLERNISRYSEVVGDKQFIANVVNGVLAESLQLDEFLQPLAPEWPLSQIARIDRVILRMAVWEMNHADNAPIKVIINEAVELAKSFGADNSSKFVNGVLGTAAKKLGKVTETKTKGVKLKQATSQNVSARPNALKEVSDEVHA